MTEARFSFTTKIGNDLFTVRGDTFDEFQSNAIAAGAVQGIGVLLAALNGELYPAATALATANVAAGLGAQPVQPSYPNGAAPGDPFGGSFTPQQGYTPSAATPPPVTAGTKTCQHGQMVKRTGVGAKGEWRAWFCPTPKGTEGQCSPAFADKRNPSEWNAF
jgi:hypothetical protein